MKTKIESKMVFLEEEDKSGWAAGIDVESIEGESECAIHVLGNGEVPLCSIYLSPIDAAMLGVGLIACAHEATEVQE